MGGEIVRIRMLHENSVVKDVKYMEKVDYAKCIVVMESLENGLMIETFYLQRTG